MSYESDSASDRLAAVRAAIAKILNAQAYTVEGQQVQYAQLKELRAMEKELMQEAASASGSSGGFTVGMVEVNP